MNQHIESAQGGLIRRCFYLAIPGRARGRAWKSQFDSRSSGCDWPLAGLLFGMSGRSLADSFALFKEVETPLEIECIPEEIHLLGDDALIVVVIAVIRDHRLRQMQCVALIGQGRTPGVRRRYQRH